MHDEDLRGTSDGDLFRSFALAFAVRAFPHLVFAEHFLLAVASETLVDVAAAGPGYLNADAVEGFVGGGGVLARGAAETRRVLASKEARNERGFAVAVPVPFFPGDNLHVRAFTDLFLFGAKRAEGIPFPVDVEVFVQAIEEEVEELFGILLSVDTPFTI